MSIKNRQLSLFIVNIITAVAFLMLATGCSKDEQEEEKTSETQSSSTQSQKSIDRPMTPEVRKNRIQQRESIELFPVFIQTTYGYGVYGYIDKKGKITIKPQFDEAHDFSEGLAVVVVDEKWGYIDKKGNFAIKPQFDKAEAFSEGLATVLVGKNWGYIDKTGNFVIKPQFKEVDYFADEAGTFSEGLAAVLTDGKWGYIDKRGKFAIKPQFDGAEDFSEDLAVVLTNGKLGYIDKRGRFAIKPQFETDVFLADKPRAFSKGLAPVALDNKWGYVDKKGEITIELEFDRARAFSEGLAAVSVDKKWGYINRKGESVIEPQFDEVEAFSEGLAKVGVETSSLSVEDAGGIPMGLTLHMHNVYGYIDKTGKIAIEPQFKYAGRFSKGLAWVNTGEAAKKQGIRNIYKEGYIDKNGNYIWNPAKKVMIEATGAEKLLKQFHSTNLQQHFSAALSLSDIGKPVVPDLIKYLDDNRWYVAITAAWALGEIGDKRAVEPLLEMLTSEEKIGPPAYTSYIGDMSFKPQKDISLYNSSNQFPGWNLLFKRRAAAIALGKIGDKRAVPGLISTLKEAQSEIEGVVVKALKKITGKDFGKDYDRWTKWWQEQKPETQKDK